MMQKTDTAQPIATQPGPDLKNQEMPSTSRTNVFSRMASVAAMSVALASEPAVAQSPTNAPTSPTPTAPGTNAYRVLSPAEVQQYVSTQVPPENAAPAAGPAINATKSNVTVLEKRPFCMDDEGNVLNLRDPRLQVRRTGQSVEGSPSKGESLRVIAEGVAHLKQMNGGQIPEGYNVKLVVSRSGASTVCLINPNVVPDIVNLSPISFDAAMRDPLTKQAIMTLHEGVHVNVRNVGGLMTMTFKEKNANTPLALSVELEKQ